MTFTLMGARVDVVAFYPIGNAQVGLGDRYWRQFQLPVTIRGLLFDGPDVVAEAGGPG